MTLSRRDFLRRTSLAVAGGLIVGDAALELFDRLTHRKVWAGADFSRASFVFAGNPQPMTVFYEHFTRETVAVWPDKHGILRVYGANVPRFAALSVEGK